MNLRGIVAVSGKTGLYKMVGQNKSGFILESLDAHKIKLVVNMSTAKLASLEDITVFGEDDDLKLVDILENMKTSAPVDLQSADPKAIRNYFRDVAPKHDEERVYASDMKKIINWFNILKELPLFTEEALEPLSDAAKAEADLSKKPDPVADERAKPVQKAAGKSATRLSQKSK